MSSKSCSLSSQTGGKDKNIYYNDDRKDFTISPSLHLYKRRFHTVEKKKKLWLHKEEQIL